MKQNSHLLSFELSEHITTNEGTLMKVDKGQKVWIKWSWRGRVNRDIFRIRLIWWTNWSNQFLGARRSFRLRGVSFWGRRGWPWYRMRRFINHILMMNNIILWWWRPRDSGFRGLRFLAILESLIKNLFLLSFTIALGHSWRTKRWNPFKWWEVIWDFNGVTKSFVQSTPYLFWDKRGNG